MWGNFSTVRKIFPKNSQNPGNKKDTTFSRYPYIPYPTCQRIPEGKAKVFPE
jgi:hypothetical protein